MKTGNVTKSIANTNVAVLNGMPKNVLSVGNIVLICSYKIISIIITIIDPNINRGILYMISFPFFISGVFGIFYSPFFS